MVLGVDVLFRPRILWPSHQTGDFKCNGHPFTAPHKLCIAHYKLGSMRVNTDRLKPTLVTPGPPPAGVTVARSRHVITGGVVETVTHLPTAVAIRAWGAF